MAFGSREGSRYSAAPVNLYLFRGAEPTLESMMRSVTLIPGTTEFGYGTTPVTRNGDSANSLNGSNKTDLRVALDDLQAAAPNLKMVSLVVAWHGTDLRIGGCLIRPKVEHNSGTDAPYEWNVGGLTRGSAILVSRINGEPAVGGAPSDRSIYEAIVEIKSRGLKVTLHPFILMDIPAENSLPNPYGGTGQPAYPWRGRITCNPAPGEPDTVDLTSTAASQVSAFFGPSTWADFGWNDTDKHVTYSGTDNWRFRRFIFHMARIAAAAGGVDDFLVGSELVGATRIRSNVNNYPMVNQLVTLVGEVKAALPGTRVSYAADWSEYHSHQRPDGTLRYHMDPLWAACDFVAIDNYLPISDWRDTGVNIDGNSATSIYDPEYLQGNIEGGEYFDWYYASSGNRSTQTRSPITDWNYRQKDLRSWWTNTHRNLTAEGVPTGAATAWVAKGKPIVFTELGCPAVHCGSNQPNVFYDAKSSESNLPYFSNGNPDAAIQRAYLEAWLSYWSPDRGNNEAGFIEWDSISLWTWDARPHPTFPRNSDYWGDAENWQLGHWLTGRIVAGRGFDAGELGPFAFTNGEEAITRAGVTYVPWPISHPDYTTTGTLDKSNINVDLARGSGLDALFNAYAPSQVLNLFIFQGHMGDDPTPSNFPLEWSGQVASVSYEDGSTLRVTVESIASSMRRPGLRRNYQLGCPHPLYGEGCRAKMAPATVIRTVTNVSGNHITVDSAPAIARGKYLGGMVMWTDEDGKSRVATITAFNASLAIYLRGYTGGINVGDQVKLILGCNRTMGDCQNLHNNILNFGGQPFIPLESPLSETSIFY